MMQLKKYKIIIIVIVLSSFKSIDDSQFYVRITDFYINRTKVTNLDSINTYFNFYSLGEKIKINHHAIDLLSIDSINFQYNNTKFELERNIYLSFFDSNYIEFFKDDTLEIDIGYYINCSKCFDDKWSDTLKLYGARINGIYIYKELE